MRKIYIMLFFSLSLLGCVDKDEHYNDKLYRNIYIHNATHRNVNYEYEILWKDSTYWLADEGKPYDPYENIPEYEHYQRGKGGLAPFKKKLIRRNWFYRYMIDKLIHIHVNIGIENPREKDYWIDCSELDANYNTIIIYDDDDTTKW